MTTLIDRTSKWLKAEEIIQLIELLDDEYKSIIFRIKLYDTKPKVLLSFRFDIKLLKIILGKHFCFATNFNNDVFLFPFNFEKINPKKYSRDDIRLLLVRALFHEIRHIYQQVFMNDKYNEETYTIENQETYDNLWIEKDADEFALTMLNRHYPKIKKILHIQS